MTETREETPEEARLREVRAKIDALNEARERRNMMSVDEQIAIEERRLKEAEALDKLEQEHGKVGRDIQIVESDVGAVIVKRPTMAVYRRFQDSGTTETKDLENLVRPCVLHPSKAEFDQMIERLPMLLRHAADACVVLAGLRVKNLQAK